MEEKWFPKDTSKMTQMEALAELEKEWADYRETVWGPAVNDGCSLTEALSILQSFA